MIERAVLNNMTIDELRNYCVHLESLMDAEKDLNFANAEVIDALQILYNRTCYRENCKERLVGKQGAVKSVVKSLEDKYSEFMPHPSPVGCCKEGVPG